MRTVKSCSLLSRRQVSQIADKPDNNVAEASLHHDAAKWRNHNAFLASEESHVYTKVHLVRLTF